MLLGVQDGGGEHGSRVAFPNCRRLQLLELGFHQFEVVSGQLRGRQSRPERSTDNDGTNGMIQFHHDTLSDSASTCFYTS